MDKYNRFEYIKYTKVLYKFIFRENEVFYHLRIVDMYMCLSNTLSCFVINPVKPLKDVFDKTVQYTKEELHQCIFHGKSLKSNKVIAALIYHLLMNNCVNIFFKGFYYSKSNFRLNVFFLGLLFEYFNSYCLHYHVLKFFEEIHAYWILLTVKRIK